MNQKQLASWRAHRADQAHFFDSTRQPQRAHASRGDILRRCTDVAYRTFLIVMAGVR